MTQQMGLVGRITIRFPRTCIAFGWVVFLSSVAATAGIGYAIMYAIMAVWPNVWGR
jgi:hypothetical protein